MLRATTACFFSTSQRPKVLQGCGVLYILTSKCSSCQSGVHFFNSSTSKSAPNPSVLALLTSKCTFSTSQLPKVLQPWCALYILTSKYASRHNGVHVFRHLNVQKCSEAVFNSSTSKNVPNPSVFALLTPK